MAKLILADYCEHNLLTKKAHRLRSKSSKVIFGWHDQYTTLSLHAKRNYGYCKGNAYWFNYGVGLGYWNGNGSCYRC